MPNKTGYYRVVVGGTAGSVHVPPVKNGVIYDMMKPKPFKITHVMIIRLSHARDSSTVFPLFEKFMSSNATADVTIAAIVDIRRI